MRAPAPRFPAENDHGKEAVIPRVHPPTTSRSRRRPLRGGVTAVALAIIAAVAPAWAEVRFPAPPVDAPIRIEASRSHLWLEETGRVWALEGGVTLEQGASRWIGQRAVLWMEERRDQPTQITAYLEGTDAKPIRVELLSGSSANAPDAKPLARQQATHWFGV